MIHHRHQKTKSGQSLIEFVFAMLGFLTIVFMMVQVSLGMAVANLMNYATFMASRAFLSGGPAPEAQRDAAIGVMESFLVGPGGPRYKGLLKGKGQGGTSIDGLTNPFPVSGRVTLAQSNSRLTAWEQGITYKFDIKMYALPILKGSKSGNKNNLELTSESFLGREPSAKECREQMVGKAGQFGTGEWKIDNGC